MLGKIIKYDIKATYPWIVILDVATILLGIMTFVSIGLFSEDVDNHMFSILLSLVPTAFGLALFAAMLMTFLVPTIHFYKSMFENEGYLTHTLPVKPSTIIIGKGFVFALWTLLGFLVFSVFAVGVGTFNFTTYDDGVEMGVQVGGLIDALGYIVQVSPLIPLYGILAIVLVTVNSVAFVYMCLAIGNLFRSHKLIWSVVIGVVLTQIFQALSMMGLFFYGNTYGGVEGNYDGSLEGAQEIFHLLLPYYYGFVAIFAVATVIFYVITERIVAKKLNLA